MRRRNLLAALFVLVVCQMAFRCPVHAPSIEIHSPSHWVDGFEFPVEIELIGQFEPGSLEVSLNHESILDRLSGGPLYSGVIEPGSPLRDFNLLLVRAREAADGRLITRAQFFAYLPPGKARARRI